MLTNPSPAAINRIFFFTLFTFSWKAQTICPDLFSNSSSPSFPQDLRTFCRSALEQSWGSNWPWGLRGAGASCIYESVDLFPVSFICLVFYQSYSLGDTWSVRQQKIYLTGSENKCDAGGGVGVRRPRPENKKNSTLNQGHSFCLVSLINTNIYRNRVVS